MFASVCLVLVAALLSLGITFVTAAVARRFALVDRSVGVPVVGGVAIALTLLASLVVLWWWDDSLLFPLLEAQGGASGGALFVAVLVVLFLGLLDDILELSPLVKLCGQLAASLIVVATGFGFVAITNPLTGGYVELGPLAPLATIAWILVVTNALNLIDGLDGLACGVGLIASFTMIGIAFLEGNTTAIAAWSILAGALLGFLAHNFPPASIILGDSGSLLLGFVVALLSMQSLQKGATAVVLSAPILVLGVPLGDTAHAIFRRWLARGPAAILRGDRDHIHHRLLRAGLSKRRAVLILYCACLAFSLLALLAVVVRGPLEALLVIVAMLAVFAVTRFLDREEAINGERESGS